MRFTYDRKKNVDDLRAKFVDKFLENKKGIEVGGSSNNDFGLDCVNIDITKDGRLEQVAEIGRKRAIDIVAPGDDMTMIKDGSVDFVFTSHVIEHFPNVVKAFVEWDRVVKPGGFIVAVIPDRKRLWGGNNKGTAIEKTIERYREGFKGTHTGHYSNWTLKEFLAVPEWMHNEGLIDWRLRDYCDPLKRNFFIVAYEVVKGEAK